MGSRSNVLPKSWHKSGVSNRIKGRLLRICLVTAYLPHGNSEDSFTNRGCLSLT
jgi:hypothetical protein